MAESRIAPPVRVLVADTSAVFQKTVVEGLTKKGFAVDVAGSAEDAFEKVRVFGPDIVFYDTEIPGYDGFEALTLLSKTRSGKEGFIIATTSSADEEIETKVLKAGARFLMSKSVGEAQILDAALMIKRHMQRPKDLPRKTRHEALKVTVRKCEREGCEASVAAFTLKGEQVAGERDQFETPIYALASGGGAFDYNLACVSVCPACYYAMDETTPPRRGTGSAKPKGAAQWALLKIAAEADDTLLVEGRTTSAALVAYRLAIENLKAEQLRGTTEAVIRLADLNFKAASVAHRAGEEGRRDRFLADAEKVSTDALALVPSTTVYRAAYRLVALYVFFARDVDAARMYRLFGQYEKPATGRMRPRDSKALETYRSAAAGILSQKGFYRRSNYLAKY